VVNGLRGGEHQGRTAGVEYGNRSSIGCFDESPLTGGLLQFSIFARSSGDHCSAMLLRQPCLIIFER
jgi:hypothetical protein